MLTEFQLHEEYLLTLTRITSTAEGRSLFLDLIERRFKGASTGPSAAASNNSNTNKVLLGKYSFSNIKESLNLFLYEVEKDCDVTNLMRLMKYFTVFC